MANGTIKRPSMFVEEIKVTGVSQGSGVQVVSATITKTGYNPVGLVGCFVTGGWFYLRSFYLGKNVADSSISAANKDATKAYADVFNGGSTSTPDVRFHVLYEKA